MQATWKRISDLFAADASRMDRYVRCTVGVLLATALWSAVDLGNLKLQSITGFLLNAVQLLVLFMLMGSTTYRIDDRLRANRQIFIGITIAMVTGLMSNVVEATEVLTGGKPTALFSATAGAFQSSGQLLLILALINYPTAARTRRERVTIWLDAATVISAVGAFIWRFTVSPHVHEGMSVSEIASVLSHPIIVFVMSSAFVKAVFAHATPVAKRSGLLAIPGMIIIGLTDAIAITVAGHHVEHWIFVARAAGLVFFALSGRAEYASLTGARAFEDHQRRPKRPFSLIPYVAITATFGLLSVELFSANSNKVWAALICVMLCTALVISRQVMAFLDNARLLKQVDTQFAELKASYEREQKARDARDAMAVQLLHAQKLESVGRLAGGLAHEINTPIQFLQSNMSFLNESFAQLLSTVEVFKTELGNRAQDLIRAADVDLEFITEEVPAAFEDSEEGLSRVASIVQSMKTFGESADAKAPTDINDSLQQAITVSSGMWSEVATAESVYAELPLIVASPADLNQVWLNLIVNAAHAIEERYGAGNSRGRIVVASGIDNERIWVTIADNGSGISEDIAQRVYDPFFTTKPVGKGAGQGLAVAYQVIVEGHGGSIDFVSDADGTTFRVELPISPVPQQKTSRELSAAHT